MLLYVVIDVLLGGGFKLVFWLGGFGGYYGLGFANLFGL